MDDVTVRSIEEIDVYSGPHAIPGIRFRPARAALGVSAWGMNVLEMDPGCDGYPEHDHEQDGQEEVYLVLRGSVVLQVGGEERKLSAGDFARVGPGAKRKLVTRDDGVVLLALGGKPGEAYAAKP